MASLGELAANLKLEGASGMLSGLRVIGGAAEKLKSLFEALETPLAILGVSFAAFKSAEGIAEGLKGVFEAGLELRTLSRTTGQSVGDLKALQSAFKETGLSTDELPSALEHMQSALGGVNDEGQPTATVFSRLGLSIQQLRGQTAIQQFQAIGAALHKLGNQTLEFAAARQILGRSGVGLLAVLDDPEAMESLGKGLSGQAAIYQRGAEVFSRITLDLESLSHKVRGFFVGLADQVAPVLLPLLDKLKSIDLTPLGEQIGGIVRTVSTAFAQGRLGELLGASLQVGALEGANSLWLALRAVADGFGQSLIAGLQISAHLIDDMTNPQNWAGLGHALIAAGFGLEAKLLEASDYLQAGMDMAVSSSIPLLRTGFSDQLRYFQSNWALALISPMSLLTDVLARAAQGFGKAMYEAIHGHLGAAVSAAEGLVHLVNPLTAITDLEGSFIKSLTGGAGSNAAPKFEDLLKARLGESAGARRDLASSGADEAARAGSTLAPLAARTLQDFREKLQAVQTAIQQGLGTGPLFDVGPAKEKLSALLAQLAKFGAAADAAGTPSVPNSLPAFGGRKEIEGDRLARIGGFIGGGGGPALDFHRRTAVATEKTVQKLGDILAKIQPGGRAVALWNP